MQNGDKALSRKIFLAKPSHCFAYLSWRSLVNVLHNFVLVMLKCIRTRFHTEPISERLSVYLDRSYVETFSLATRTLFSFQYLEIILISKHSPWVVHITVG